MEAQWRKKGDAAADEQRAKKKPATESGQKILEAM
jgi:hypothetical protein